jgi:hypothetical protein
VHIKNESSISFSKKAQSRRRARRSLDDEVNKAFVNLKSPLLELNKCPDLIVNRGPLLVLHFNGFWEGCSRPQQS